MTKNTNTTNHDDQLFEILKECNTLPTFLDTIFGFLNRRTDFYCILTKPDSPIGLPLNYAETLVKQTFYKWKIDQQEFQSKEPQVEVIKPGRVTEETETVGETQFFTPSEYYNGAVYSNYCWSQSIQEIDIYIKIPETYTTKDLTVQITNTHVSVKPHDGLEIVQGELCGKCKSSDAIWSLDRSKLTIHLDKCRELWWNCLLKCEKDRLDVSKLDCTRPFEELPDEAQAKIEELQWNQERKRLGLPTSNELEMRRVLEGAWNAEGSPFKGEPYDPSRVQF